MIDRNQIDQIIGQDVYSTDGDKIGRAGQVYLDDQTGQAEWVTVHTGLFGSNESFVPLRDAELSQDRVVVNYAKDQVKDAPNVDPDNGHIDESEEDRLYEHYGLHGTIDTPRSEVSDVTTGRDGTDEVYDQDRDANTGRSEQTDRGQDRDEQEITLAQEQLRVGTESRERGRVRLRKYVTTEEQTVTVPVQREEVRLERVPVSDADQAQLDSGSAFTEEEHEVVLHEDVPVVDKQVQAAEKVRLAKDATTEEHTVSEEVRKEHVATEGLDEVDGGTQDTGPDEEQLR